MEYCQDVQNFATVFSQMAQIATDAAKTSQVLDERLRWNIFVGEPDKNAARSLAFALDQSDRWFRNNSLLVAEIARKCATQPGPEPCA